MDEMVSIVMPAYNCVNTIVESVTSVLAQSHPNFELLIVDDCSNKETASVLNALIQKDNRIKVFRHLENQGVAAARNTALEQAKGKYIAFLDADDIWHPEKLKTQITFMREEKCSFTYSDYQVFKDDIGGRQNLGKRYLPNALSYHDLAQRGHTIGTLSVILDCCILGSTRFQKIGHEDFAMWLALLRCNSIIARKVPSVSCLAYYRVSANSISSSKLKAAKWMWKILWKNENLDFLRALYGFSRYAIRAALRSV